MDNPQVPLTKKKARLSQVHLSFREFPSNVGTIYRFLQPEQSPTFACTGSPCHQPPDPRNHDGFMPRRWGNVTKRYKRSTNMAFWQHLRINRGIKEQLIPPCLFLCGYGEAFGLVLVCLVRSTFQGNSSYQVIGPVASSFCSSFRKSPITSQALMSRWCKNAFSGGKRPC